jgi:DNA-binding response OmpR family regulator
MVERNESQPAWADPQPPLILVVEDNPDVRRVLELLLGRVGYRVHAVPDAETALQDLPGLGRVALAVIDVHLPGRSGFELCHDLAAAASAPPVILLTASSGERDAATGLAAGALRYLTKPFRNDHLLAEVRDLVHRSAASR